MGSKDRIDKLLSNKYNISRQDANLLIESGKIYIGKRQIIKSHSKISLKDLEKIDINKKDLEDLENLKKKKQETILNEEKTSIEEKKEIDFLKKALQIIYEDEDILIINKPKGLVVYSGVGKEKTTVVSILKEKHTLSNLYGEERLGIVHRLDKDTSGIMIVAKNNDAHKYYESLFKERKIQKEYIALVKGSIQESKGKIDMPIIRSSKDFKKMEASLKGKEAITYFNVIERFDKYTLVNINIETGRTHQIRVHFSQIAYPIVGDKKYSRGKNDFNINSQLLHAYLLKFTDRNGKKREFKIDIPEEFENILKIIRNKQIKK